MLTFDFETYSAAGYKELGGSFTPLGKGKPGLMAINASTYSRHPSTEVISMAYAGKLWVPGCNDPTDLLHYLYEGGLIEAHNSAFEYYIWNNVCAPKYGWPMLSMSQLRCSMAKASAYGLPGALATIAKHLTPEHAKDPRGKRLISLLSIPKKPSMMDLDTRRTVELYPELYTEMYEYNKQDVVAEEAVSAAMPDLSPHELSVWQLNQKINERGVQVDTVSVNACISLFELAHRKYTDELIELTGGAVKTIDEIVKGGAGDTWLRSIGVEMDSLSKDHVDAILDGPPIHPHAKRAFEIRQLLGSASIKKLYAISRMTNEDSRLRDLFAYCGAERTGRFAGRGAQPQNLKNSGPAAVECMGCGIIRDDSVETCPYCGNSDALTREWGNASTEAALYQARLGLGLDHFMRYWPDPVFTLSACIRGLLIAAPGKKLVCSDYSAIEAVVLAEVAGESWRQEVFRTHGKIYEMSAAKISGIPFDEIMAHKTSTGNHHPLRKKVGKVAELGSGYGGWIGAWKNFGAGKFMDDEEIKQNILKWRDESPAIVELWGGQYRKIPGKWEFYPEMYGVEGCVIQAISNPMTTYSYKMLSFVYDSKCDTLEIRLPSGRNLYYHKPRLTPGTDPRGLSCINISYLGGKGFTRISTYGSKLVENIIQAISRDILVAAMLRVEKAGYRVVLHVHDEIIAEVPEDFGSVEELEELMMIKEPWFATWPIRAAGGWTGNRFRK